VLYKAIFTLLYFTDRETWISVDGVMLVRLPENALLLVMEFVSNGCLRDYLKKNNKTTPDELLRFSLEIVEVFSHLTCWQKMCCNSGYQ